MKWKRLDAWAGSKSKGCLNCGGVHESLKLTQPLAVGFGIVEVTRDGELVWGGDDEHVWLRRFERRAAEDPDHDWRVRFYAPLWDGTYQRHGDKHWVLVQKGMGFA